MKQRHQHMQVSSTIKARNDDETQAMKPVGQQKCEKNQDR